MGRRKIRIPEKELWRIDEVAKFFNVCERTIRLWINDGKIKSFRVQKTILVPRYAVIDCIKDEDEHDELSGKSTN